MPFMLETDKSQDPPRVHSEHDAEHDQDQEDAESDSSEELPYDIPELAAIFVDFYQFLATLHYDPADLKMPPAEGWNTAILPPAIVSSKSEEVVALLKVMPYFNENGRTTHVHYKSNLIDYTDPEQHDLANSYEQILQDVLEDSQDDDKPSDYSRLLTIAGGYESGGRTLILDVFNGEITEDIVRCSTCGPEHARNFFEDLKERFRSLQLIPCPGREIGGLRAPELDREIAEDEIRAQTEEWGTDLDWQFVRQVYRHYGWPDNFRSQEAFRFIDDFMAQIVDLREEWERYQYEETNRLPRNFEPWLDQTPAPMFKYMQHVALCGYTFWPNRAMNRVNLKDRELIQMGEYSTYGDELELQVTMREGWVDDVKNALTGQLNGAAKFFLKKVLSKVDFLFRITREHVSAPLGLSRFRDPASGWDYDW